ncbi:MAG: monovalent cation/H+ antiporter subunit D family protein [Gammaproteobacteria bacterium]|nr:monovalent cation/H+ antiporter subunit D family protein [Gammaproteobacteria bacterium]
MSSHLPVLQVVVPLLAAPLCVLLKRPAVLWAFSLIVSILSAVMAYLLLQQTADGNIISYAMGGWAAPWGIEYRVDTLNAYVLLIVASISSLVLLGGRKSIEKEIETARLSHFYTAYLLCFAGLLGITITGDAFNVFVFLEISSIASYALISLGRDRRALTAAYQYLIMGTIGATFILIGIGMMYMVTGTLNMHDLAQRLPEVSNSRTLMTSFAFLFVGVSLKLALFPLHLWLPNAYTYAPSIVSAFLAGTATKVAVYVLMRFIFTVYGIEYAFTALPLSAILMLLAIAAIMLASMSAVYEDNIKRLFAYSSVAQLGYMVLGISFLSVAGLTSSLLHLFNHALMKAALFMALACVMYQQGNVLMGNIKGLGKRMPWTFGAIVIGGLSLVGVPLTVGFISKWYLILAAIEAGHMLLVAIVLVGSLIALVYVWKLVEQGYFQEGDEKITKQEAPMSLLLGTWFLVLANIYFGIDTSLTVGVAESTAQQLLGVSP